jgi:hypothetical protein
MIGQTRWIFPDGDLPERGDAKEGGPHGHESLVVFNPNNQPADVRLTVYFPDRPPVRDIRFRVDAERVRCVRMDEPVGEQAYRVPKGQYALVLESSTPVVAQIGRMDVQQANLAYYTVMGHPG